MLGLVDWHLITLFMALFVVVRAFEHTGVPGAVVERLAAAGLPLDATLVLGPLSVLLSNVVSNVPAVMLLVGHLPTADPVPWYVLALSSTLAGNLILIGSIANLIVAEQAALSGVELGFREHARTGVPVTLATLAVAWIWVLALE
jgi:Na+/H+ antiporter NhaD/arsenite permease-like protein